MLHDEKVSRRMMIGNSAGSPAGDEFECHGGTSTEAQGEGTALLPSMNERRDREHWEKLRVLHENQEETERTLVAGSLLAVAVVFVGSQVYLTPQDTQSEVVEEAGNQELSQLKMPLVVDTETHALVQSLPLAIEQLTALKSRISSGQEVSDDALYAVDPELSSLMWAFDRLADDGANQERYYRDLSASIAALLQSRDVESRVSIEPLAFHLQLGRVVARMEQFAYYNDAGLSASFLPRQDPLTDGQEVDLYKLSGDLMNNLCKSLLPVQHKEQQVLAEIGDHESLILSLEEFKRALNLQGRSVPETERQCRELYEATQRVLDLHQFLDGQSKNIEGAEKFELPIRQLISKLALLPSH